MAPSRLGGLLHQDHLDTIALLDALEARTTGRQAARPLDAADAADRELAERLIAIVDREVVGHFAFEEGVLFPILWENGLQDMVTMLTHEHAQIGPLAKEMATLAARIAGGGSLDAEAWGHFRSVAADLVQAALFHIQKEEMGLVQRLGGLLDPETDAALADRYQTAVD
jgi:hemerythrin-like domain-containing protein